jgi:hypothetical protein
MWIVGVLLLVASVMGCNSKDPLSLLLEDLEQATEARDIDAFEKRLASSFTGNGHITREESIATLRRYFLAYERITVDLTNVNRAKNGNRVDFQVRFSGRVNAAFNLQNLLPSAAVYHFELRLVQETGTLKVQKAFWKEISSGF